MWFICTRIIISPNEVLGDIMILASMPPPPPPPCPPEDPDNINALTQKIFYRYLSIFDIFRTLEQLRSQPNDTLYPPNL